MHFTPILLSAAFALGSAAASTSSSSLNPSSQPTTSQSSSSMTVLSFFNPNVDFVTQFAASIITANASDYVLAVACPTESGSNGRCSTNATETITVGPSTFAQTATSPSQNSSVSCSPTHDGFYCSSHVTYTTITGTTDAVRTISGGTSLVTGTVNVQTFTITAGPTTTGSSGGPSGASSSSSSGSGSSNVAQTMRPLAVAAMAVPAGIALLAAAL